MSARPADDGAAGDLMAICAPLGLAPSVEQAQALQGFMGLLARWNGTYNLTAVRDPAAMRIQHLADCLAVVAPLARHSLATRWDVRGRLLDVGSGGGLPGVVIATLLQGWDVTCVDAVGKKAAFVRQAAGDLGLKNLHAVHSRVESLKAPAFDVITSRAFASLADFVAGTRALLAPGGVWMAMKGQRPESEIAALPADVEVFHVEQLQVPQLDAQRCLVWMRLRKTG